MNRRSFLGVLGGLTLTGGLAARGQILPRRLGAITPGAPLAPDSPRGSALLGGLAKRGYRLGQNLVYETRGAGGKIGQIPDLLEELKAAHVEVVVTVGYPTAVAAKAVQLPTVLASGAGDPVATGLVQTFAHPGGTVTGISDDAAMLSTKRLGLLTELSPRPRRIAMLWNRDDLAMSLRFEASQKAARDIGISVQALGVREPNDFDEAFLAMEQQPPDAILMVSDSLTLLNRKRVIDFARQRKLPAIYEADTIVREGGLMSYGADERESFDRAASFVQRIFEGEAPANLPFEQPNRYLFVINLKIAKAMNLAVPNTLLAFADEVIE